MPSPTSPHSPAATLLALSMYTPSSRLASGSSASAARCLGAGLEPCPPQMVHLGRFCIDRYEAHLLRRDPEHGWQQHPYYERPRAHVRYVAACAPGVFPQGYVSRAEAEAACEAAGKRLCSFAEWRGACRGKHGWHHPYAARRNRGACNSAKPHLLTKLFGPDSREWHYDKHFNSPLLNQERGFLAMSGSHPDCASPFGVQDLVGNLHEWVSGEVNESFVDALDEEDVERHDQSWRVGNGIFVGGFYSTEDQLGPGCMYVTIAHEPRYHDYSTGFRCCTNAPARADPKRARQDRLGQR